MNRRTIFAFFLATAIALPANWKLNPFKHSKDKSSAEDSTAESTKTHKSKSDSKHEFDGMYTGGTVAHIPQFTNGKLDLSDAQTLHFHYGKPTWSLDYAKITSIEVADKKVAPRMVKLPKLMQDKRVFTIGFQGDTGKKQNLILELPVQTALTALPLLEERTGKAAIVEGQGEPGAPWTDKYWKTARNSSTWDQTQTTAVAAK